MDGDISGLRAPRKHWPTGIPTPLKLSALLGRPSSGLRGASQVLIISIARFPSLIRLGLAKMVSGIAGPDVLLLQIRSATPRARYRQDGRDLHCNFTILTIAVDPIGNFAIPQG